MAWRQLESPEEKGEKAQEAVEWLESPPEEAGVAGHPGLPLWTQGSKPLQSYHGDRVTKS